MLRMGRPTNPSRSTSPRTAGPNSLSRVTRRTTIRQLLPTGIETATTPRHGWILRRTARHGYRKDLEGTRGGELSATSGHGYPQTAVRALCREAITQLPTTGTHQRSIVRNDRSWVDFAVNYRPCTCRRALRCPWPVVRSNDHLWIPTSGSSRQQPPRQPAPAYRKAHLRKPRTVRGRTGLSNWAWRYVGAGSGERKRQAGVGRRNRPVDDEPSTRNPSEDAVP